MTKTSFLSSLSYLRLLDLTPDPNTAPDTFSLDRSELTEDNFDQVFSTLVTDF